MANVNMSKRLYCMQDGKDWNKEMLYFEDDEDIAKVRIDGQQVVKEQEREKNVGYLGEGKQQIEWKEEGSVNVGSTSNENKEDSANKPQKQERVTGTNLQSQDGSKGKTKCGCGRTYSCTSSLYLHIRSKHNSIAPPGTFCGVKGVMKTYCLENNIGQQESINRERESERKVDVLTNETIGKTGSVTTSKQSNILDNCEREREHNLELQSQPQTQTKPYLVQADNQSPVQIDKPNATVCWCHCGRKYLSKSALILHTKHKHKDNMQQYLRMAKNNPYQTNTNTLTPISTIQKPSCKSSNQPITYNKQIYEFTCKCSDVFFTPGSLRNHMKHKHSRGTTQQQKHICGCTKIYSSKSALNLHIKRKHDGIMPDLNCRNGGKDNSQEELSVGRVDEQSSIYDSDDDLAIGRKNVDNFRNGKVDNLDNLEYQEQEEKIVEESNVISNQSKSASKTGGDIARPLYKCGCGRDYLSSSALNLHIKKRHEAIVPNWTIQGTKGVRVNGVNRVIDYKRFTGTNGDEGKIVQIGKQSNKVRCNNCGQTQGLQLSCRKCSQPHQLCQTCFWLKNYFQPEHQWEIVEDN